MNPPPVATQLAKVELAVRGSYDRSAIVTQELGNANISRDVVRIAPLPGLDAEYLHFYLQSDFAQRYLKVHARGVAVKGVNIASIRAMPVAVPPLATQRRIVEAIQQQLTVIEASENAVRQAKHRVAALRRALLGHAFKGELVAHGQVDEPASVILERIQSLSRNSAGKEIQRIKRSHAASTPKSELLPPPKAIGPASTDVFQQELLL